MQIVNFTGEGFFKIEKLKNEKVVERLEFKNLILNSGYDLLMGTADVNPFKYCVVGSGNTAEAVSQTALVNKIGYISGGGISDFEISDGKTSINQSERFVAITVVYTSAVGGVVGNISEIGISPNTAGTGIFSRALVKDGLGNPTSVTVLADEQLRVAYEFRIYQPTADLFVGNVSGRDIIMRCANVNSLSYPDWGIASISGVGQSLGFANEPYSQSYISSYSGNIGLITEDPTGAKSDGFSDWSFTYIGGGVVDIQFTIPTTSGNFTPSGVRSVAFSAGPGRFQAQFDPAIPKTSEDRIILKFRFTFERRV